MLFLQFELILDKSLSISGGKDLFGECGQRMMEVKETHFKLSLLTAA